MCTLGVAHKIPPTGAQLARAHSNERRRVGGVLMTTWAGRRWEVFTHTKTYEINTLDPIGGVVVSECDATHITLCARAAGARTFKRAAASRWGFDANLGWEKVGSVHPHQNRWD